MGTTGRTWIAFPGLILAFSLLGPAFGADTEAVEIKGLWKGGVDLTAIEVRGLSAETLESVRTHLAGTEPPRWQDLFTVHTRTGAPVGGRPPVAGNYALAEDRLRFEPLFPFLAGQTYIARWHPPWSPQAAIERSFALAEPAQEPATRLTAIYPSADSVPENLLKVYLQFSTPMSRGEAVDRIRLLDADGQEVPAPFVAPHHELWNARTDRLTLFLDPGRIKRGVGPNEALGPPLQAGKSYRLVVDREWSDAQGQPLIAGFEKTFRVTAPDREQPSADAWRLIPPARETAPVVLEFPEPLDRALLERLIRVLDASGQGVPGTVTILHAERRWSFQPDTVWPRGNYEVRIDSALEDLAGNSLRRAFETAYGAADGGAEAVRLAFTVP